MATHRHVPVFHAQAGGGLSELWQLLVDAADIKPWILSLA